jgi:long-chain acyl-CoA synthetase
MTMDLGFWRIAAADRERVALVVDGERSYTAGELFDSANAHVHGLRALGLEPGDQLAVVLPNGVELIELYLAALQAGWRFTPINHHLVGPEIAYIVNNCGAKVFVGHSDFATSCERAASEFDHIGPAERFAVGAVAGFRPFNEIAAGQPTTTPTGRTAGAAMHYTSGTTGKPKGVRRALFEIDPDDLAALMTGLQQLFGVTPGGDNVHLCCSPLYHTAPLMWLGSSLHLGHRVVLMQHFDATRLMELISEQRVTCSHLVPTHFIRLLATIPPDERGNWDVSSLRSMCHAAAPCPPEVKRQMIDWWGDAIWEYYAATEGGGTIISSAEWLEKPGSVGRPWPGSEIKILDDHQRELPTGSTGTVYMSVAQADFEYLDDPTKTRDNRWQGFFTVGDVGLLDDDGYLFLKDRKTDMIISGGVNIYPAEIEAVLVGAPGVADAAVFGIPSAEWGEEIKAVIELLPGVDDSPALRADITRHLTDQLAGFKHPRSIDVVDQLPRDPSGKLFKRRLRDPYWPEERNG